MKRVEIHLLQSGKAKKTFFFLLRGNNSEQYTWWNETVISHRPRSQNQNKSRKIDYYNCENTRANKSPVVVVLSSVDDSTQTIGIRIRAGVRTIYTVWQCGLGTSPNYFPQKWISIRYSLLARCVNQCEKRKSVVARVQRGKNSKWENEPEESK